jgi:serine-threonine kinase receptor-associated protein
MEKLVRIYDLERPDAEPRKLEGAAKGIRNVTWAQNDSLIITTQQDTPGIDVWDTKAGGIVKSLPTDATVSSIDVSGRG